MDIERNHHILIVDDTRAIHDDFHKILKPRVDTSALEEDEEALFGGYSSTRFPSYELTSTYQGQDGIAAVRAAKAAGCGFALAFVDMRMPPGMDGLETIEQMWLIDPDIQVVVCTAYTDYSWGQIVKRFGTVDRLLILKKPFDTMEVAQLACSLTEKWHLAKHAHLKLSQLRAMVDEQTRTLEATNRRLLDEVREHRKSTEALRQSEERFALAAAGSSDGLWDWDLRLGVTYYSSRWRTMLGLGEGQFQCTIDAWYALIHEDDRERVKELLVEHLRGFTAQFVSEHRVKHAEQGHRWVLCRGQAVRAPGRDEALRIAGSQTDITDRVMLEQQLRHDALHDALTGLPNRAMLATRIGRCLHRLQDDPRSLFAVLYIDLDHFKVINDSLGHLIGDELLKAVAHRLNSTLRVGQFASAAQTEDAQDLVRLGGDEFVLLCRDIQAPSDAVRMAERLALALAQPFDIERNEIYSSASVGIAVSHGGYACAEDLLRDADTALYQAKAAGRGSYKLFDARMHETAMDRWRLENDLRHAIERNELRLHYQPILDLRTSDVVALEILVRWQHPERGLLYPDAFLPLAEDSGLIVAVDNWVLREACKVRGQWQKSAGHDRFPAIAVNMSAKRLAQPDLVDEIRVLLESTGVAPASLHLEIVETSVMETGPSMLASLTRLRDLGLSLHLDDFGTGYSSLAYLHKMPVAVLKIDRSFVASMMTDPMSHSIVQTIVTLGHTLGIRVTGEGIETTEQRDRLLALGCDYGQGYLFHRPMPAARVEELLALEAPAPTSFAA